MPDWSDLNLYGSPNDPNAPSEMSPMEEFESYLQTQFAQLPESLNVQYQTKVFPDFVRTVMKLRPDDPLYKSMEGVADQPLITDLQPGPSVNVGGEAFRTVAPYAREGYGGVFGSEGLIRSLESQEARNPNVAFREYFKIAFAPELLESWRTPQQNWGRALSLGYEGKSGFVAGGISQLARPVSSRDTLDWVANQFRVGISGDVPDRAGAWRALQGNIQAAAQIPFEQRTDKERVWGSLVGKAPYSQDLRGGGKSLALADVGLVQSSGTTPGNIDYSVYGYGGDAAERLKRLSIIGATPGSPGGHRERATLLRQEGKNLVGMDPRYITSEGATAWERQAGLRYANIARGTDRPSAIVAPGAFATKATPAEGSSIVYRNPIPEAFTAARSGGHREYEIPYNNLLDVAKYRFDWGIMKEQRAEGGGVTYEKQRPLKGASIEGGSSAIIGTYTYGKTTVPLRLASPGRPTTIEGEPTVFMPPGFQKGSGEGHPGVDIDPTGKKALPVDYMPTNKYSAGFQEAFGTKDIRYETRGGVQVHIPTSTHTWLAGKGEGSRKTTYTPVQEPIIGATPQPYSPTVKLGGEQFPVSMLEQAPKNPLVDFQAGLEYSPIETIHSAMGLIPGKTGKALQAYVEPHHEKYSAGGTTPMQVQPEELGRIYAEGTGQEYVRGASYMNLMEDLYGRVLKMPQKEAAEQYGFAFTGRPQKLPLSAMPTETAEYLEQQAMHGARSAVGKNLSDIEAKKISRQVFSRQPVGPGGYEGVEETFVRGAGLYSTHVARPVPEYASKQPITGYEEMASISAIDPKLAEEYGLGVDQGPGATGFMPEHVQAWRQIGDIFRYRWEREATGQMLGKEVRPTPSPVTALTREQGAKILTELEDMGENPDFERIAKLTGGIGPYKHWKTGELYPHASAVAATTKNRFEGTEFEEPLNRASRLFVPGFEDFLKGKYYEPMSEQEAAGFDPSGGQDVPVQSRKMAALQSEYRQIFELSHGGTLLKELSGKFSPEHVAGRFGLSFGGLYDVLMQPAQMDTIFKQMAQMSDPKTARRQEALMRQQWAEQAMLPGMFGRQPVVQREGGVRPANLVSPEHFRRQGIHVQKGSVVRGEGTDLQKGNVLSTGVVGQVNPAIAASMIGDFDADQGDVRVAATGDPILGFIASQNPALAQYLAAPTLDKLKSIDTQMIKAFGSKHGVPAGEFNIESEAFKDIINTLPGRGGFQKWKDKPTTGAIPVGKTFDEGLKGISVEGAMGAAYNLRRMVEASGAALGFGDVPTTGMHGGMTKSYQEPLDALRSSLNRLETAANTALFTTNKGEQAKIIMKAGQEQGWKEPWLQGEPQPAYNYEMARFTSGLIGKDAAYQPEATAYMFANREEDIPALAKSIQERGVQSALIGKGGYIYNEGYQFGQSPLGNALESIAIGKTFGWRGKPPKEVRLAGGRVEQVATTAARQTFPFRGQDLAIGKLGEEFTPQLTMALYEKATRENLQTPFQSLMFNKAIERAPGGRKNAPPSLRYWFSQYEGHRDVQALQLEAGGGWKPPRDISERSAISQKARSGQTHIAATGSGWYMGRAELVSATGPEDIKVPAEWESTIATTHGGVEGFRQEVFSQYGGEKAGMTDLLGVNIIPSQGGVQKTPNYYVPSAGGGTSAGAAQAGVTTPKAQTPANQPLRLTEGQRSPSTPRPQAGTGGSGEQPPASGGMPPFIPMGAGDGGQEDWFKRLTGSLVEGNKALLEGTMQAKLDIYHYGQGRTVTEDWRKLTRGMTQIGGMQDWWRGGGAGFTADIADRIGASVGLTGDEREMFMRGDKGVIGAKMAAWMDVDQEDFLKTYREWEAGGQKGKPVGGISLLAKTRQASYQGAQAVKRGKLRDTDLGKTYPMAGQLQHISEFESGVALERGGAGAQGLATFVGDAMQEQAQTLGVAGRSKQAKILGDDRADIIASSKKLTDSFTKLNEQVDKGTISQKDARIESERLAIAETRLQKRITGSLLSQQAERISGATPQELREGKFEEQMGAYMGLSKQYRRLEQQETALTQPPTTATKSSQALRKMIGGWGLFYMGHLARMGLAPMQAGYQEYQQYAQQGDQMAQAAYGPGVVDPYAGPEMFRQRGLLRSGGGAWGAIQRAGAKGMGTPLQDLSAAALGGVGAYGLAMHTAGAMGAAGFGSAVGLAGAAPAIGLAVGGAMLVGQQIGYAQDPQGSIIQAAATGVGGGWWNEQSANYRTIGPQAAWGLSGKAPIPELLGDPDSPRLRREELTKRVEQFAAGTMPTGGVFVASEGGERPMTENQMLEFAQAYGAAEIEGQEHLTPEIKAQLAFMAARSGVADKEALGRLGTAIQAGRDVIGVSEKMFALSGMAPPTTEEKYKFAIGSLSEDMPEERVRKIESGAELMAATPGILQDTQGMPPELTMLVAENIYAPIAGGAYQQQFLDRKQLQDTRRRFGLKTFVDPLRYSRKKRWGPDDFTFETQRNMLEQRGVGLAGKLSGAGVGQERMEGVVGQAEGDYEAMELTERLFNFEPIAMTQAAMTGALPNVFASMDINQQGQVTGLPWGTTGLQRGSRSATAVAGDVWGDRWKGTEWGEAAVEGIETPSGDTVAGMRGLQWLQRNKTAEYQRTQAGIQMQQLKLGFAFQTGVGLEGYGTQDPRTGQAFDIQGSGGLWGVQDRQRRLQHQQQQWGFQYQQQSFELQGQQFEENMALQRTGQLMRRGWKREDWDYQDLTRNMQWGWKQEDFQENVRFMSGRQRKLAERGMERETIMFNLEGGQIEKGRDRQEKLWKLEDERFELTKTHFAETRALQAENMQKQREFYEEGKKLSDQQLELTRAYYVEQYELSMKQAGAAAAYNETMIEINNAMAELGDHQQDYQGQLKIAMTQTTALINALADGYNHIIREIKKGGEIGGYNGPGDPDNPSNDPKPSGRAIGGPTMPKMPYLISEQGTELVSDKPLSIMPNAELRALFMRGKELPDPFGTPDYIQTTASRGQEAGPRTIIINIGNERLGKFILEAVSNELEIY